MGFREEQVEMVATVMEPEVSSKGYWNRGRVVLWVAGVVGLVCAEMALGGISWAASLG